MYLLVLSENLKTSLCSRTTVFPGFAGTFSFGTRLTPLNLASLDGNAPLSRSELLRFSSISASKKALKARFEFSMLFLWIS